MSGWHIFAIIIAIFGIFSFISRIVNLFSGLGDEIENGNVTHDEYKHKSIIAENTSDNKPVVKYPITDSRKTDEGRKEDILTKNCINIDNNNYMTGYLFNNRVFEALSQKNILFILEAYTVLYWLTIYHLKKKNVNTKIIARVMVISQEVVNKTKAWEGLNLSVDELENYKNNRMSNYNKIINVHGSLNEDFYNALVDYLTQLVCEIVKNNKLSFFNPLPKDVLDHKTPLHLDIFLVSNVRRLIQDFIVEDIIPISAGMDRLFCDAIFYREDNFK